MSMHDPKQAAQEAKRAVKELGLKGIMLNDFQEAENGTKMLFYDQPEYDPFWAMVQELDGTAYFYPKLQVADYFFDSSRIYSSSWST